MQNYFETFEKKDCNGCGVCALKCPKGAIKMIEDEEGFLYPKIDKNLCINCNLCKKICPNKAYDKKNETISYIAINKNKDDLLNSASGGCFLPIAQYILSNNGVIFGVKYDEEMKAVHDFVDNPKDLKLMQGSKYVRSDLKNSYEKVKYFLELNRYVLFSGTPCQCQGLRTFLGKNYDKLFTCEIICHANPSPKVFKMYKNNLENRNKNKIVNIEFRSKKNGWDNQVPIITYSNGKTEEEQLYYIGFINELFNRPSCHNCHFSGTNRLSDFTIGDAWGIEYLNKNIKNDNTGISLFCINTKKGLALMKYLKMKISLFDVNVENAFYYNHNSCVPMSKNRSKFFDGISSGKINDNNILEYIDKYTRVSLIKKCKNKCKKIIKKIIKK